MHGWLSWLSIQLQLRSSSHDSRVRAPHQALCWQLKAWSLLHILCLPLFALPLLMLCVSLSKTNKLKKKKCLKKGVFYKPKLHQEHFIRKGRKCSVRTINTKKHHLFFQKRPVLSSQPSLLLLLNLGEGKISVKHQ